MLVIEKKQIKHWLAGLKKDFKVFDTKRSVLPAKKYFFPAREKVFAYDKKKAVLKSPVFKKNLVVVCRWLGQLEAMMQLDEIMKNPTPDFFYWCRREGSALIGILEYSLTEPPSAGDLILEKINARQYRVFILTEKGKSFVREEFFREVAAPEIKKYPAHKNPLKEMLLDAEFLAEAVSWSWENMPEFWEDLGAQCLGCGICAYVCPLCHCFSIEDRVELSDKQCMRCRSWAACTLPEFARVAGGHNFHRTIKERYYNWCYHKFVRSYKEFGRSQCVACGSCQRACPAGIDIGEVIKQICQTYTSRKK